MRQKQWTKKGRELRESNPSLFTGGRGKTPHFKGGAHGRDVDYKRSDKRNEERQVQRGRFDDDY